MAQAKRLHVAIMYSPNGELEGARVVPSRAGEIAEHHKGRQGQVQVAVYRPRDEALVVTPLVEVRRWYREKWRDVPAAKDVKGEGSVG